jgi:hypothetical protein
MSTNEGAEPMTESIVVPPDVESWMRCYTMSIERYERVCMAVFEHIADGRPLRALVDFVADSMDGCDCVDEESIALYQRAKTAAIERDAERR